MPYETESGTPCTDLVERSVALCPQTYAELRRAFDGECNPVLCQPAGISGLVLHGTAFLGHVAIPLGGVFVTHGGLPGIGSPDWKPPYNSHPEEVYVGLLDHWPQSVRLMDWLELRLSSLTMQT